MRVSMTDLHVVFRALPYRLYRSGPGHVVLYGPGLRYGKWEFEDPDEVVDARRLCRVMARVYGAGRVDGVRAREERAGESPIDRMLARANRFRRGPIALAERRP